MTTDNLNAQAVEQLQRQVDDLTFKWTSEPPKSSGWYWWSDAFNCQGIRWFHGKNHGEDFSLQSNWKFAGPIQEPQAPTL